METKEVDNKILEMVHDILDCNYGEVDDSQVYDVLVKYVGIEEIIRYKHEKDYELDGREIDFLVGLI